MSRPFGWDLPPGITNQMIEDQAGEAECDFCSRPEDECDEDPCEDIIRLKEQRLDEETL